MSRVACAALVCGLAAVPKQTPCAATANTNRTWCDTDAGATVGLLCSQAHVVNLRDAAAEGSRGLLHPLLKRFHVR
jgi:hypothetical protein